jgi:PAS domain S-box-containing protein
MTTKRILLVEDEFLIAMLEKSQLEERGYQVIHANKGHQAIDLVFGSEQAVDLILMDIDLGGGIDGTQAAEKILLEKDIPIVFLSSHTESEVVEKTEKITSYGYVVKNSGITVLDASIKMAFKLFYANRRVNEKQMTLEAALNSMSGAVCITDAQGDFLEYNDAFVDFHKWEDKKQCPQTIAQYSSVMEMTTLENQPVEHDNWPMAKALRGESGLNVEYRLNSKKGLERWLGSFNYAPIKDAGGAIIGTVIAGRDITQIRKAEEKIREMDLRIRKLFNNIPDMVYQFTRRTDGSYFVPIASDGIRNVFGCTPEDVADDFDPIARVLHPDDAARVVADIEYSAQNMSYFTCEFRVILPDKGVQWIFSRSAPERLPDGSTTWFGFNANITERKLAQEALKEESALLSKLMETSPVGIVTVNAEGAISYANKRAEEILGLTKSQIESRTYDAPEWRHTDPEGNPYPPEQQPFNIVKSTNQTVYGVRQGILWPDGHTIMLSINASPLKNANGDFSGMVATLEDITGRIVNEKMIIEQLKEKEILLKEVHHRIKNNISSIESLLNIQAEELEDGKAKAILQEAVGRVRSVRIIYDRMLESKNYQNASVKDYLQELIAAVMEIYPEKHSAVIEADIEDFCLESKKLFPLGAIVNELITNAMKYAFPLDRKGRITVKLHRKTEEAVLDVNDDGAGLPEDFDPDSSGGFGLMLAKMLSQQINGSFEIKNGDGTKCRVRFPIP